MNLRMPLCINLAGLAAWTFLSVWASMIGVGRANLLLQHLPFSAAAWIIFGAIGASLLWLYIQCWRMLAHEWTRRPERENAKLVAILVIGNFLAVYYFYWKRYAIDSDVA